MDNVNLCKILKGHEGETFYSPIFGDLTFVCTIYPDVRFKTSSGDIWDINPNGKLYNNSDELCVFPSKDQRDWNKWLKTQNSIIKTFNDLLSSDKCIPYGCAIDNNYYGKCYLKTEEPIEKSAFALFIIYQLIELGYGGNITKEEWEDKEIKKWIISFDENFDSFDVNFASTPYCWTHIAFHTKEQAEEFLSKPENVQLLKDYFMI